MLASTGRNEGGSDLVGITWYISRACCMEGRSVKDIERMENRWMARTVILGILMVGSAVPAICVAASCFKVMDATLYSDKPDMEALGIQPIRLVDPSRWWHGVPNDEKSLKEATSQATKPLIAEKLPVLIDLELQLVGNSPDIAANRQR